MEERKKRLEQELFYKRATERLLKLEQMEVDRKIRFERELQKLHNANNIR
jgi:hypothetical protein